MRYGHKFGLATCARSLNLSRQRGIYFASLENS